MSSPALPSLHQALRKSFQRLESDQKVWVSVLAECSPLIVSVGNLAEQLTALSSVQLSTTPLKVFPDLEERLRFKLLHAVDAALVKLNELMWVACGEAARCHDKETCCSCWLEFLTCFVTSLRCSLQSVRDSISHQVSAAFQLYEQNRASLDLVTVTGRSPTAPSICDMLAWLQDAERHYRQQYPFSSSCVLPSLAPQFLNSSSAPVQTGEEKSSSADTEGRPTLTFRVFSQKMEGFGVSQHGGKYHR